LAVETIIFRLHLCQAL
jgi:hypothetical protein